MSKFNNIKNLNNFKIKQENQKLYEINQKNNNNNNLINNSMVIINDKSTIKTNNSNLLPFTQNGRGNKAAIKVRNSLPSFSGYNATVAELWPRDGGNIDRERFR